MFFILAIYGGISMKIIYSILAIVLLVFLVSGCTNAPVTNNIQTGNNLTPAGDNNAPSTGTNAKLKQCDATINYQVLIDALPKNVNGYIGDTPQGNMLTFTNPTDQSVIKYSTASVSLVKDDKSIDVTLTDTCYIQYLSMAWLGFYESEGTDGYLKKTTISGYTGWHQYEKSSDQYSYDLFVKDRVIVTVQGRDGVADSDVTAAVNAIGFASIAAAAT